MIGKYDVNSYLDTLRAKRCAEEGASESLRYSQRHLCWYGVWCLVLVQALSDGGAMEDCTSLLSSLQCNSISGTDLVDGSSFAALSSDPPRPETDNCGDATRNVALSWRVSTGFTWLDAATTTVVGDLLKSAAVSSLLPYSVPIPPSCDSKFPLLFIASRLWSSRWLILYSITPDSFLPGLETCKGKIIQWIYWYWVVMGKSFSSKPYAPLYFYLYIIWVAK